MNTYASNNAWQSPMDMTYDWNYSAGQSPKAMVGHYNDVGNNLTLTET